jgi:hypothetical protein
MTQTTAAAAAVTTTTVQVTRKSNNPTMISLKIPIKILEKENLKFYKNIIPK